MILTLELLTGLTFNYFFSGCTSTSTTFNDLWRLDPTTREWSKPLATGAYPSPKACATFVKSKPGELILFGGWSHPSPYPLHQSWRLFNELHTYDISNMRWTQITPGTSLKPPTMAGHSATVHKGRMIVFLGLQWKILGSCLRWKIRKFDPDQTESVVIAGITGWLGIPFTRIGSGSSR